LQAVCEICGNPIKSIPNSVEIDGAILRVCGSCAKLGRPVKAASVGIAQFAPARVAMKHIANVEADYEVDPDYYLLIREAREKMGLTQDELGKLINEKPSVIRLIETRKLKPDLMVTRKLMHQLKINLLVPESELEKQ
jgi:putative transcription factor